MPRKKAAPAAVPKKKAAFVATPETPAPTAHRSPRRTSVVEAHPYLSAHERMARARDLATKVTKELKGRGRVDVGADIAELEYDHIRTGHVAIDYVTNGGLIRGRISEFWGLEGSSKTTSLALIIAKLQSEGMLCAIAPIEGIDKGWWRTLGCYIPYSKDELSKMDPLKRTKALGYNSHYERLGYPPLTVIQHHAGDHALQLVYELTKANLYDLIAVDSLGGVKSSRFLEEKTVVDTAEYGGEAALFGRFCNFMYSALNTRYDAEGNANVDGQTPNRTAVVCINQARQTFGTMARAEHNKFHQPGGQALRHAWSQSLFFSDVEDFAELVPYDRFKRRDVYAKMFRVLGTKMRGGPEQREARYTLHLKNHEHDGMAWRAGTLDNVGTVRALGVQLGVITQAASSYFFGGTHKWRGKDAVDIDLRGNPDLYLHVLDTVLTRAIEESSSGSVPDYGEA